MAPGRPRPAIFWWNVPRCGRTGDWSSLGRWANAWLHIQVWMRVDHVPPRASLNQLFEEGELAQCGLQCPRASVSWPQVDETNCSWGVSSPGRFRGCLERGPAYTTEIMRSDLDHPRSWTKGRGARPQQRSSMHQTWLARLDVIVLELCFLGHRTHTHTPGTSDAFVAFVVVGHTFPIAPTAGDGFHSIRAWQGLSLSR